MSRRRVIRPDGAIAAGRLRRTPPPAPRLAFRTDPWTRRLLRPVMIALLATSVAVALLVIVRIASPDVAWMALVPLCLLVALEGAYTTAWLNNPDSFGVDRSVYRAAEMVLIVVLARIYSWVLFGGGIPSPEAMRQFLTSPGTMLAAGGFFTTAFVTLVAWWFTVLLGRIFARLDVSIYELDFYTMSPAEQKDRGDDRPIQMARDQLLNEYLTLWLGGGIMMILLAALSTFEVGQLASITSPFEITRLGLAPAMLFALLTYFLIGFWLLSHARLLRMNARWLMDGYARGADFERRWQRGALFLIIGIALVAAFLPIGSSLAISEILKLGFSGVGYLIGLLMSSLTRLFSAAMTQNAEELANQPPEFERPPYNPPIIPPMSESNSAASSIITFAFWTVIIALIVASLLFFLRERGYHFDKNFARERLGTIREWLREVRRRLGRRANSIRRDLMRRPAASISEVSPSPAAKAKSWFPGIKPSSPRDQIRFYYLALVQRASDQGVRRRTSETPLEFSRELKEAWPESNDALDEMTDAFLEARYSPQPIEKDKVLAIREQWARLKGKLRPHK